MVIVSKISTLCKKYVSIVEAAETVSSEFKEGVTEADVLQYCLDGQLTLSVLLSTDTPAKRCQKVPIAEAKTKTIPCIVGDRHIEGFEGVELDDNEHVLEVLDQIVEFKQRKVLDCCLIGSEAAKLQASCFSGQIEGIESNLSTDGLFVTTKDGMFYQLQRVEFPSILTFEDSPFYVSRGLDDSTVPVIRFGELAQFIQKQNGKPSDSSAEGPLNTKEKNSLCRIIAILTESAGYDLFGHNNLGAVLESEANRLNLDVKKTTINKALKAAREELEKASKKQSSTF